MKTFLLTICFLSVQTGMVAIAQDKEQTPVYLDDTQPIEVRVQDALNRMTVEEKTRLSYAQGKFSSPGCPRLGIPELWMSDGPHGVRAEINWNDWGYAGWTNDSCTAFPALTCLAAGGGTALAYISDSAYVSNQLAVAGENGLNARLTEPSWNPRKGLLTVPGAVIPKDPQVTNTSELDMNELVALKCEFVYTDSCPDPSKKGKLLSAADMKKAVDVYRIDYNSDDPKKSDWIRFQNQKDTDPVQCFYYSRVLKRNFPGEGETTVPLFTQVSVDKSVNYARQNKVLEMGGVEIRISGHVLQQMSGEASYGLDNPKAAYEAGLFQFQ